MFENVFVSRFNGTAEASSSSGGNNASGGAISSSELEALKQDILKEMRKDMNKMKQEIIDGENDLKWLMKKLVLNDCFYSVSVIRQEMNRR